MNAKKKNAIVQAVRRVFPDAKMSYGQLTVWRNSKGWGITAKRPLAPDIDGHWFVTVARIGEHGVEEYVPFRVFHMQTAELAAFLNKPHRWLGFTTCCERAANWLLLTDDEGHEQVTLKCDNSKHWISNMRVRVMTEHDVRAYLYANDTAIGICQDDRIGVAMTIDTNSPRDYSVLRYLGRKRAIVIEYQSAHTDPVEEDDAVNDWQRIGSVYVIDPNYLRRADPREWPTDIAWELDPRNL